MLSSNQVPAEIEQVLHSSMCTQKPLSLTHRLESPHPSLPDPGRLMRLFCPIILILFCTADHTRHQLSMRNTITPQLIGNDLPWLSSIAPQ